MNAFQIDENTEIPSSRHKLMKRFDNFCGGGRGFTANVDDVIACFNYLERLGHTDCGVPAGNNGVEFCFAGTAGINGVSFNGPATSSYWYEKSNREKSFFWLSL